MTDLAFHALAAKVHAAPSAADLAFIFCNETHALASYRQAALVGFFGARRTRLAAHSGLADIDANSPYALWLADVANHVRKQLDGLPASARVLALSPAMLPSALAAQWADWMPDHVWVMSLAGPDGRARAALLLGRETPWPAEFDAGAPEFLLLQAAAMYGHAWWALTERRRSVGTLWSGLWARRAFRWALIALPLALLVPVREYALVPAEVVSNHSQVISSPRESVIKRMVVKPNTPVEAGAVLAELDDSTIYNRQAVAQAALASARVDLLQASQRAIETQAAKAELNIAEGKLRERQVDVDALQREMGQLLIKAPSAGVFVYSDPNDWAGRPVQTGERVGLLADPAVLGLQAWAPVNEAVNLKPGAAMTLFMRVAPLDPVEARLDYAGYQVIEAPNGVASYLLRGTVEGTSAQARIGLRGTARISGDWTVLGYLMFRRPFAAVREWCGC
ncbi:efflux RND transporter periplasmic adaptor subunit [Variovorax sp. LG9.2]|uniref:efflux RND transporter periplasmic adaptor subunit n=1 Tax=Variovorax sp. LG9.2 TaxID=3048626 RepID=UPI002B237BEF|nr:efflux RND transporter periplasmic adaptor subunit [Variovorax sp. LG9.2]MEB0057276.1 efflux RND transporter periplasmic adaptor subunit [Variovorax sp. LG9.2]